MHAEKVQSFVLSSLDYGDSDRIVSLFTLEHGRVKAFARGARKSRKRFGPALEPFARIDAQARIKEGLSSLQQADIVCIYPAIRADLERIAHALYACELVDAITPEGHPLPRLFRLLAAYLDRLETETAAEGDRRFFEINLLNILGYRPALETCSRCDSPFGETGAWLQDGGEQVCRFCCAAGRALSSATLKTLSACLKTGIFGQISFPTETLVEAGYLLDGAISAHTGRRLKSLEFLEQVSQ
jgi:DNA repair protein RecO (recombination protein O)